MVESAYPADGGEGAMLSPTFRDLSLKGFTG